MTFDRTKRNRYFLDPTEFPHSSRNHAEDLEEFHIPNQRMQNANLHVWGIARGLEVSGAAGVEQITVSPGVALDIEGRLIALSADGHADIGANPPGNQHNEIGVPAVISLALHSGQTVYVTISYSEILRPAEGSGGRLEVVPWIRLQPTTGAGAYVDDGASVILAIADIDSVARLSSLSPSDGALTYGRRVIGQSVEAMEIRRSVNTANTVQETPSARLEPHPGGGLDISVTGTGDIIKMAGDGGGRFSDFVVNADHLSVKDGSGNDALRFDSSSAWLAVGSTGNEGDLRIRNNYNVDSISMDGGTGNITANGTIRSNGNILGANPTRNVHVVSLWAGNSSRYELHTVDLGSERRFLAFTAVCGLDPLADHDRGDAWAAEVYMIDGVRRGTWVYGGDHWGPSGDYKNVRRGVVRSTGQTIMFRTRTYDNAELFTIGVVIYE